MSNSIVLFKEVFEVNGINKVLQVRFLGTIFLRLFFWGSGKKPQKSAPTEISCLNIHKETY